MNIITAPAGLGIGKDTEDGTEYGLWAWHHQLWLAPIAEKVTIETFGDFSAGPFSGDQKLKVEKGYYRHFKGDFYLVSGVARIWGNDELRVVYQEVPIGGELHFRPVAMFKEAVSGSREERNIVWRFQKIPTY